MTSTYRLTFRNNSMNTSSVFLYQKDPKPSSGEHSLIWLANQAYPDMNVEFKWKMEYGFVWGQMGNLQPGAIFNAFENINADLSSSNEITFGFKDGNPQFSDQRPGPVKETLFITNSGDVQMNQFVEGISMSGHGTFLFQAQPNMEVQFTPHLTYWIGFGDYQQGEVLDPNLMAEGDFIGSKQIYGLPTKVLFPVNVYAMTATLNPDNTWTIEPS